MNLSSITNGILALIAEKDENALSKYEIDSKKELDELGRFLNGEISLSQANYSVNKLEEKDKNVLKQIYDNLKEKFSNTDTSLADGDWNSLYNPQNSDRKEYLNIIQRINKDNVLALDVTILNKMFTNEITKDGDKKKIFKHISGLFLEKATEIGLSPEEIEHIELNIKQAKTPEDFEHLTRELWSSLKFNKREEYAKQKELEKIKNNTLDPNDERSELQKYADNYWSENKDKLKKNVNNFGIGYNLADGDLYSTKKTGDFATTQKTGNCWAMAGINSFGVNKEGKELMNSQVYKDSMHGLYVVQLPEAKNKGFGKDGKGIYILTDSELWRTANISDGDLDVAAYNLAVKKYLEESGERGPEEDSLNGNTAQRLYEISRGIEAQEFSTEVPDGVGVCKAYAQAPNGRYKRKSDEELGKLYDSLVKHVESGGEVTLGVNTNMYGHGLHALSVVGVKDGKFIIQESNNNEEYAKSFNDSWSDKNNTWNMVLDKEKFIEILHTVGTNKF